MRAVRGVAEGDERRIVVATGNPGKAREIARMLLAFEVESLAGFAPVDFPEEGGDYVENARVKALTAARAVGFACVADDSGLEVDALDGAPGAYSARFGGPGLDDAGRSAHLLQALADVPAPRSARFRCVAACGWPDGTWVVAEGVCEGRILEAPRGDGGFGYDPVFQPEGFDRSMAELSSADKDALSHRGRAMTRLSAEIESLLASSGR
jgi:XTP/dITP diphosphohydrolase